MNDINENVLMKIEYTHLASRASANTPAASGAAADVPLWVVVHFPYKSVVACKKIYNEIKTKISSSFWK